MARGFLTHLRRTFSSLRLYNYRLWAVGALISNIGTWMQRIAQDWLVLTVLTQHSGAAVGIVMALQFGPPILLMPLVGHVADTMDRRKLLIATQTAMGLTALGLGILVVAGIVELWHVYLFAGLTGCATAFDSPIRQTFVAELVGEDDLQNAVALNSTLFNSARMIGPALAGLTITAIGMGWVFIVNALSFVAVLAALMRMRLCDLRPLSRTSADSASAASGPRYVWGRRDLVLALTMLFLVGTYGLNFPIFISTMSVSVFHGGPHLYGLLTSAMAVGSVIGALLVAGNKQTNLKKLVISAFTFGIACAIAAIMPTFWTFGLALLGLGVISQTYTTSSNSFVQLSSDPAMRGRVMAIYMAIFLGCTPLGAPLVGWVADAWGPRWAMGIGAASGIAAGLVGAGYFVRSRAGRHSAEE